MEYRGIRRDGWPSTVSGRCGEFGRNRPPECSRFVEGVPRFYDKRGVEITREELDAIPNPLGRETDENDGMD
jgi:hypothetical protein